MFDIKVSNKTIEYPQAIDFMENMVEKIHQKEQKQTIWLLEHPPLYTAGTSAKNCDLLEKNKLPVYQAKRGGQYTYHGPGQRIAYIMLELKNFNYDIKKFIKFIEETAIEALGNFGINAFTKNDKIGIWVKEKNYDKKIGAIGVRVRHKISYHGLAINICPDMTNFNGIIPCGIKDFGVTSFEKLGIKTTLKDFDKELIKSFEENYKKTCNKD